MSKKKTLLIVLTGAIVAIAALFAVRAAGSNPERILARAEKFFQEQSFDEAGRHRADRPDPRLGRARPAGPPVRARPGPAGPTGRAWA